ncbi:MAG: hypothetical protein WAU91_20340 [Desulfatitalea sp.]
MKSKLRNRWIMVGCIWWVALGLTWWNFAKIDALAAAREVNEELRKELSFQRQNAKRLEQVTAVHEKLFLTVESVDLGMIAVRNRLYTLAAAFDLRDLKMNTEMNQAADGQIPFTLALRGPFENVVGFLSAVHPYAYLTVRRASIKAVTGDREVEVELALAVHYKIVVPSALSNTLPQVTSHPSAPEGKPL